MAMSGAFCWPQSAGAGETVDLMISAPGPVEVRVVRQGGDDVEVLRERCADVSPQAAEGVSVTGCDWPVTLRIVVDPAWPSGFYLVTVRAEDGSCVHAFFVVRAAKPGRALFVLSTSTWAAYDDWGGPSFYTGGHLSSLRRPLPAGFLAKADPLRWRIARIAEQARDDVRAFFAEHSFWCMAAGWANQELLFARWAEAQGLEFDYAVSQDLHAHGPALLDGHAAYVSVGHDEYWSAAMRDAVEDWVDDGGHAAFFSGNTAFWQIRFEAADSRIVGYKLALEEDPVFGTGEERSLSTMWSDPLVGRPENAMTGVSFTRGGYAHMRNAPLGSGGYTLWRPEHWAFEGLDLRAGDLLGAEPVVVGYECDGCALTLRDGLPEPTGEDGTPAGFEVLGTAPAHLWETAEGLASGLPDDYVGELNWVAERLAGADTDANRRRFALGRAVLGTFERGRGAVFTTGCTDWAYGLDDAAVALVTRNVLTRFGAV